MAPAVRRVPLGTRAPLALPFLSPVVGAFVPPIDIPATDDAPMPLLAVVFFISARLVFLRFFCLNLVKLFL